MADLFAPEFFQPTIFAPFGEAPSPQQAYQNNLVSAANLSASLHVPQTPVFVPPPVQPQPTPGSGGVGFGEFATLFTAAANNPIPPNQPIAPPTITLDNNGGLVMPPPAPQNPVTFGVPTTGMPQAAPPAIAPGDPGTGFWTMMGFD